MVGGLILRDKVRGLELRSQASPALHGQEPEKLVWASGRDDSQTDPWGNVSGMSIREGTPGADLGNAVQIISLTLGMPWDSPRGARGNVWERRRGVSWPPC